MRRLSRAALMLLTAACGGGLPARYVIEHDLAGYHFRRYQQTLEAQLPIAGNPAHSYTAAYMRRHDRGVQVVTALVSVYARPARLTEQLREELSELPGYELATEARAGQSVWVLRASAEPTYWMWPAGRYLVKLGAPAGQVLPEGLLQAYAELYPSDLDAYGHARSDAASAGSEPEPAEDEPTPLPASVSTPRKAAARALAEPEPAR